MKIAIDQLVSELLINIGMTSVCACLAGTVGSIAVRAAWLR